MTKYRVTLDGRVVDEELSYREACELAEKIDNDSRNYWKEVDIEPMEPDIFWLLG